MTLSRVTLLVAACAAATLRLAGAARLRSVNVDAGVAVAATSDEGFLYDYSKHGEDWAMGQCASRQRQSPIDLASSEQPSTGKFSVSYNLLTEPFEFTNNGHSLSADLRGLGLGGISRDNVYYEITHMNVHAMAEHRIDGVRKPAEIHLVHKRYDSDALLVVAVPLDCGTRPPAGGAPPSAAAQAYTAPPMTDANYSAIVQGLLRVQPPPVNHKVRLPGGKGPSAMDLAGFVAGAAYLEYAGSTTAPPCAENTLWLVRSTASVASDAQVRRLHDAIYGSTFGFGNYRNPMPVAGRTVAVRVPVVEDPPALRSEQPVVAAAVLPAVSREYRSMKWAKDALRVARSSMDYVRDLDARLHAAADAQANGLATPALPALDPKNPMWATAMVAGPAPALAPAPAPCAAAASADQAVAMAKTIREAAHVAVAQAAAQVAAEAKTQASMAAQSAAEMVLKELQAKNPQAIAAR